MSSPFVVLSRLNDAGIALTVHGNRLVYQIPEGALDTQTRSQLLAYLRKHKAGMIEAIQAKAEEDVAARPASAFGWRSILPTWPIAWRRRWGLRANELAQHGVPWPEDEARAFAEAVRKRWGDQHAS
jgi:hypothetical protein